MLKTLFPAVFLWVCTCVVASPQEVWILGDAAPLEKNLDVAVTVIQRAEQDMVYWAQPLETDPAGKAAVKDFVAKTRTNYAMVDPFAFQFRLAGIESAVMEGTDLSNDDFKQEVDEAIRRTVEDKRVVLKCYAYFKKHVVPVCDAYDRDGISLVESLVKQGWVLPNEKLGIVSEKQQARLDAALEQAKQNQVGAWRPFHNMFRGLN